MLWAAFCCAFFGFLRSSEFTAPTMKTFEPHTTLLYTDITITEPYVNINIKVSKTDPFRQGCTVKLAPTGADICPVKAILSFMPFHPSKNGPLFTFADGTFLTRRRLNNILHKALPCSNRPITSHSFRIGAATTAAAAGYPRWLIQQLGRWNSDCFRIYIQIPDSTFSGVSQTMCRVTKTHATWDPDLC